MTTPWALVADIGGTNARFARVEARGQIHARVDFTTDEFTSFEDALDACLARFGGPDGCMAAYFAAAGPVSDGAIELTNNKWRLETVDIERRLDGVPVRLLNDLQASALSIPYLSDVDMITVRNARGRRPARAARMAVNVGTGFGTSVLLDLEGKPISLPGEAGHMSFAAASEAEFPLLASVSPEFQSVEDVLSGDGLERLYRLYFQTIGNIEDFSPLDAREIFTAAQQNPGARWAADIFERILARTCGDLVLATGAWDGVYMFGSVLKGWHGAGTDHSKFENTFTSKGRMSDRMTGVPVHLVTNGDAPLIGLAYQAISPD